MNWFKKHKLVWAKEKEFTSNEVQEIPEEYSVLEPIWDILLIYMNTLKILSESNVNRIRYTGTELMVDEMNGMEEYLDFLKDDISAGVGIPKEQLFGRQSIPIEFNEQTFLEEFKNKVERIRNNEARQDYIDTIDANVQAMQEAGLLETDQFYVDLAQDIMRMNGDAGEPTIQMVQQIDERFHRLASELNNPVLLLRNVVQANREFRNRVIRVLNSMNAEDIRNLRQMIIAINPPVREWQPTQDTFQRVVITITSEDISRNIYDHTVPFYVRFSLDGELQETVYRIERSNHYLRNEYREREYVEFYASIIPVPPLNNEIRLYRPNPSTLPRVSNSFDGPIVTANGTTETHNIDVILIPRTAFSIRSVPIGYELRKELERKQNIKQEFKVSEHITLKLEKKLSLIDLGHRYQTARNELETNIYINGKKFQQCKYLLLNIDTTDKELYKKQKQIESIDEAAELLSRKMETNHSIISPEEEFKGHCSNLQAWYENDYNINILHSNLSIPLLRELSKYDNRAKMRFKEQIIERIVKTGVNAFKIFKKDLEHFTKPELQILLEQMDQETIGELLFGYLWSNKRAGTMNMTSNISLDDLERELEDDYYDDP